MPQQRGHFTQSFCVVATLGGRRLIHTGPGQSGANVTTESLKSCRHAASAAVCPYLLGAPKASPPPTHPPLTQTSRLRTTNRRLKPPPSPSPPLSRRGPGVPLRWAPPSAVLIRIREEPY